jgi:deoxyxylulose-5-phosphate synthase
MTLPDLFQEHDTQEAMLREAGLDAKGIAEVALKLVRPSAPLAAAQPALQER